MCHLFILIQILRIFRFIRHWNEILLLVAQAAYRLNMARTSETADSYSLLVKRIMSFDRSQCAELWAGTFQKA